MLSRNQVAIQNTHRGSRLVATNSASFMTKSGATANHIKMSLLQRGIAGSKIGTYQQIGGAYVPMRNFSYPDHIKVEMPNLSPTMEKVSSFYDVLFSGRILGFHYHHLFMVLS